MYTHYAHTNKLYHTVMYNQCLYLSVNYIQSDFLFTFLSLNENKILKHLFKKTYNSHIIFLNYENIFSSICF